MDYEKKYKEALERAKKLYEQGTITESLSNVFPELKESEDERIRTGLINGFKECLQKSQYPKNAQKYWHNIKIEDILAWLEKQGESIKIKKDKNYLCTKTHKYAGIEWIKGTKYYASDNYTLVNQGCEYYCPEYSKEEHNNLFKEVKYDGCLVKQGEQKPIDNVDSKFKVGDWCIDNEDSTIFQIVKVLDNTYTYKTNEGKEYSCTQYSLENDAKLWTIADAKDGDVLTNKWGVIIIFRGIGNTRWPDVIDYHCYYDCYREDFTVQDGVEYWGNIENNQLEPATKEQRDHLFEKMKEAGYEWDAEKKELKKVEDENYDGEDYGIDSIFHAQRILEKTLGKVDGYQTDDGILSHKCAISAIKKLYEQKPTWSEEDEHEFQIIQKIICDSDTSSTLANRLSNWLKSLKQRMGV